MFSSYFQVYLTARYCCEQLLFPKNFRVVHFYGCKKGVHLVVHFYGCKNLVASKYSSVKTFKYCVA